MRLSNSDRNKRVALGNGHPGRQWLGNSNPALALRATDGATQGATPSGALG